MKGEIRVPILSQALSRRSDCFSSAFFGRCVDALMLEEKEKMLYDEMAASLMEIRNDQEKKK